MIRIVSALFVFALLLCAWIVLRGGDESTTQVARASGAADLMAAPLEIPGPAPVAMTSASDLVDTAAPDLDLLRQASESVLSDLAPEPAAAPLLAQAGTQNDSVGQSALTGILAARGLDRTTPDLAQAVSQALHQGQPDSYVEALLKEAASEGLIEVAPELHTAEGEVDTRTLLGQIVAQASGEGTDPSRPAAVLPDMTGVETRTVQRAEGTETYRFYTVQSGDSLGGIAQRFYGDASAFQTLFDANRQLISSPDHIRVGQRLVIPAR